MSTQSLTAVGVDRGYDAPTRHLMMTLIISVETRESRRRRRKEKRRMTREKENKEQRLGEGGTQRTEGSSTEFSGLKEVESPFPRRNLFSAFLYP